MKWPWVRWRELEKAEGDLRELQGTVEKVLEPFGQGRLSDNWIDKDFGFNVWVGRHRWIAESAMAERKWLRVRVKELEKAEREAQARIRNQTERLIGGAGRLKLMLERIEGAVGEVKERLEGTES